MVSVGALAGLLLLLAANTVLAGVATRFARLWAVSRVGTLTAVVVAVPLALIASTLLLSGVLGLGVDVGDPTLAWLLAIAFPGALGVTIDYLWVASPEEVEVALDA
ncbi:MAG: hypothetical protein ACLFM8_00110 [Halobacteriales archaeon]